MNQLIEQKITENGLQADLNKTEIVSKTCFIIMPISDAPGYDLGHFKRVYDYIIKPACKKAGFSPIRADDVKGTNMIVIDILKRIINSDIAICDLSSKNPNVLYELGIRQSFDLPVTLIKDELTDRIFDIQGFRDVNYKSSLRIDEVNIAIENLAASLTETYGNKQLDVNSIVDLLGISKATIKEPVQISPDTEVILNALGDINSKINSLEKIKSPAQPTRPSRPHPVFLGSLHDGTNVFLHEKITHDPLGDGIIVGSENSEKGIMLIIDFKGKLYKAPIQSTTLSQDDLPF